MAKAPKKAAAKKATGIHMMPNGMPMSDAEMQGMMGVKAPVKKTAKSKMPYKTGK